MKILYHVSMLQTASLFKFRRIRQIGSYFVSINHRMGTWSNRPSLQARCIWSRITKRNMYLVAFCSRPACEKETSLTGLKPPTHIPFSYDPWILIKLNVLVWNNNQNLELKYIVWMFHSCNYCVCIICQEKIIESFPKNNTSQTYKIFLTAIKAVQKDFFKAKFFILIV